MIWANHVYLNVGGGEKETWYPENHTWKSQGKGKFVCDDDSWRRVTDRLSPAGANLLVVELNDAVVFPRRPELANSSAWSAEKMAAEVRRVRARGVEVVPLVNFAATHDYWLKDYNRMVGTPTYYDVCRDVIRDVCDIFGHPKYFHLGLDEEGMAQIRDFKGIGTFRRGRALWHDIGFYAKCCEKGGSRPWMWADAIAEDEKGFCENVPKSIVQSGWYYWQLFENEPTNRRGFERMHWQIYEKLARGGFDQIPCGSVWTEDKEPLPNQLAALIEHVCKVVPKKNLLGFLQTTWEPLIPGAGCEAKNMKALDCLEEARRNYEKGV